MSNDDGDGTTLNITVNQVKDYIISSFKDYAPGPDIEGTETLLMTRNDLERTVVNYKVDDLKDYIGSSVKDLIYYIRNAGVLAPTFWLFINTAFDTLYGPGIINRYTLTLTMTPSGTLVGESSNFPVRLQVEFDGDDAIYNIDTTKNFVVDHNVFESGGRGRQWRLEFDFIVSCPVTDTLSIPNQILTAYNDSSSSFLIEDFNVTSERIRAQDEFLFTAP